MVNALSVLGWGVGGIEAEAVMLGQPISMTVPDVIGVKISGQLKEGLTATDLVLTITEKLRNLMWLESLLNFLVAELRVYLYQKDQLSQIWHQSMVQPVVYFPLTRKQ